MLNPAAFRAACRPSLHNYVRDRLGVVCVRMDWVGAARGRPDASREYEPMSLRKLMKKARKPAKTAARGVAIALRPALMAGDAWRGRRIAARTRRIRPQSRRRD